MSESGTAPADAPKKKGDLGPRLLTAAIGVPLILAMAFYAPNWVIWLFFAATTAIGAQEWLSMCAPRSPGLTVVTSVWAAAMVSAFYWAPPVSLLGTAAGGLVLTTIVAVWGDDVERAQARITGAISGAFYCALLFGSLLSLAATPGDPSQVGAQQAGWLLFPMFVIWAGDTGAYFAGRAFGKHKLAPKLSPKKTWEGAVGGAVASLGGGLLAATLMLDGLALWQVAVLAVPGAVLGQMGDLCESALKRATGVKDSGRILYGHGGILDRVDALMFAGPWFVLAKALVGA